MKFFYIFYLINRSYYLKVVSFLVCFVLIFFSCEKNNHIRTYRLPKVSVEDPIKNQPVNNVKEVNLKWEKPEPWVEVQGHSMRLASFQVPYSNGFGDLSITTFSGNSGGVSANVNRWLGQIGLEPLTSEKIDSLTIIKTGKLGRFLFFKLINPLSTEKAIIASIYEINNRSIFVKLMSEYSCLIENEDDFISFCKSIELSNES